MIYLVYSKENFFKTLADQQAMTRSLLKTALSQEYDLDYDPCGMIRNIWGKPMLKDHPDIHFNISHCSGGVALSLSLYKTGIDMEKVRPFSMITGMKVLAEDELSAITQSQNPERDFFRFWTLKESYAKALGAGLAYPLRKVVFNVGHDLSVICNKKGCRFRLFENDWGFITAVCCLSEDERSIGAVVSHLLP